VCYANAEVPILSMREWCSLFPNGLPASYTDIDGEIDIQACLPNIERGCVREFKLWATTRNAERAQRLASCPIRGVFPLLDALKREAENGDAVSLREDPDHLLRPAPAAGAPDER